MTDTSRKPGILSSTFHFPEIMLNIITRSTICCFAVHRTRCSVSDSLAIPLGRDRSCPEYKVVIPLRRDRLCRIRKAKKAHLRKEGEVVEKG